MKSYDKACGSRHWSIRERSGGSTAVLLFLVVVEGALQSADVLSPLLVGRPLVRRCCALVARLLAVLPHVAGVLLALARHCPLLAALIVVGAPR
jgi:hypothetical protein